MKYKSLIFITLLILSVPTRNAEAEDPPQTQTTRNQNCNPDSSSFASSLHPEFPFLTSAWWKPVTGSTHKQCDKISVFPPQRAMRRVPSTSFSFTGTFLSPQAF